MAGPNKNREKVETEELNGGVVGNNKVTNLLGQGLEYSSNALQVLSNIWDGSNLVADVDNTNTTTETVTVDQSADDGSDRVLIKGSSGNNRAEVYWDGSNVILNPISGDVDLNNQNIKNVGSFTTEQINSEDLTNATQDDLLAVGSSPPDLTTIGAFQWQAELGSPYTNSGNSINPSGLDSFDLYLIFFREEDTSGSSNNLSMQVGGDTGSNYEQITKGGGSSTGNSDWSTITVNGGNEVNTGWLLLNEKRDGVGLEVFHGEARTGNVKYGENTNVSWPPSQFTLKRGTGTDWDVRIWGRDI